MVLNWYLALEVVVDDVEHATDPEWVAGVDELVGAAVETAELHLAVGQPEHQARDIQLVQPAHDRKCRHATESKPAMCLAADDVGDAALWGLRGEDVFSHALKNILI